MSADVEFGSQPPQQVNARLFYHLAQFVVWSQAHSDLVAGHSDLKDLMCTAEAALGNAGIRENSRTAG
jgi:hypothetical protein